MSTGTPPKVKRTIILEPLLGDDGLVIKQRGEAEQTVLDLLGSLWSVGGALRIVADRVKIGDLPGAGGAPDEPLGETVGLIIEYQANTPLNAASVTAALMDQVHAQHEEPDVPEDELPLEPAAAGDDGDDGTGVPVNEED